MAQEKKQKGRRPGRSDHPAPREEGRWADLPAKERKCRVDRWIFRALIYPAEPIGL